VRSVRQQIGDPPQLPHGNTDGDDDEAANRGGGAGANEGISEAELVDRNAKSDHHEARDNGKNTNAQQQTPHALPILPQDQQLLDQQLSPCFAG
jgi:hypothetical protein